VKKTKMVKNMKNEKTNENRDELAAIGIGAMIVFIALILVAAVAAAVIIQTAEKLQQNAQSTGEDTTDMMAGKIFINSVVLTGAGGGSLYMTFELAPGSDPLLATAIEYNLICEGTGGGANGLSQFGNFGSIAAPATTITGTAASQLGTAGAAANILPGGTYTVIITPTGNCAPAALASDTLVIQAGSGGFTYEVLKYGATVNAGDVVV
jgi:flagellin FlaB